jgi:hypothetical protein
MNDTTRLEALADLSEELSCAELHAQRGLALPEKTAMSTIHVSIGFPVDNFAMPINLATAINNESPESWAIADADQVVLIEQVDDEGTVPPPGYHD